MTFGFVVGHGNAIAGILATANGVGSAIKGGGIRIVEVVGETDSTTTGRGRATGGRRMRTVDMGHAILIPRLTRGVNDQPEDVGLTGYKAIGVRIGNIVIGNVGRGLMLHQLLRLRCRGHDCGSTRSAVRGSFIFLVTFKRDKLNATTRRDRGVPRNQIIWRGLLHRLLRVKDLQKLLLLPILVDMFDSLLHTLRKRRHDVRGVGNNLVIYGSKSVCEDLNTHLGVLLLALEFHVLTMKTKKCPDCMTKLSSKKAVLNPKSVSILVQSQSLALDVCHLLEQVLSLDNLMRPHILKSENCGSEPLILVKGKTSGANSLPQLPVLGLGFCTVCFELGILSLEPGILSLSNLELLLHFFTAVSAKGSGGGLEEERSQNQRGEKGALYRYWRAPRQRKISKAGSVTQDEMN